MKPIPSDFQKKLKNCTGAYVLIHTSPDGDCVAGAYLISSALKMLGKETVIFTDNKFKFFEQAGRISFLVRDKSILDVRVSDFIYLDKRLGNNPIFIVIDCSHLRRIGKFAAELPTSELSEMLKNDVIVIDHHIPQEKMSYPCYIDSGASSATELCYNVVEDVLKIKSSSLLSGIAFYGIASDTGFFKFSTEKNGAETFSLVSRLIKNGVSPAMVNAAVNYGHPTGYQYYFSALLKNVDFICNGRVVYIEDDRLFYEKYGTLLRPSDELYSILLNTEKVEVLIFVKYSVDPEYIDCSLRVSAVSDFDAAAFCANFGGGGHTKASAFHIKSDIKEIGAKVKELIAKEIKKTA